MTQLRDFFMAELILFYISHIEAPMMHRETFILHCDLEPAPHKCISQKCFTNSY